MHSSIKELLIDTLKPKEDVLQSSKDVCLGEPHAIPLIRMLLVACHSKNLCLLSLDIGN